MRMRRILAGTVLLLGWAAAAGLAAEDAVNFSFDKVNIGTFVQVVGEATGRRIVVADDVEGRITVVGPPVKRTEVYALFTAILESAGCAVIEDGPLVRVVKSGGRKTLLTPVVTDEPRGGGLMTRVFHLEHVPASAVAKVLEPRVTGGALGAVEETNHLVVTDTVPALRLIEAIIAQLDRPGLARSTEVVELRFAGAEALADQLNAAMADSETRAELTRRRLANAAGAPRPEASRSASVIAAPHSNQVILIGSAGQIGEMKRLIARMDVEAPPGRGRLNAIFLKYISAEEAAKNLSALLAPAPPSADGKAEGGLRRGSIGIQASPANNALLVDSTAGEFEVVRQLVENIDIMPRQVHISVLIAEVTAGDSFDFKAEFAAVDAPSRVGDSVLQGGSLFSQDATKSILNNVQSGLFPRGITMGVARGASKKTDGTIVSGYPGVFNIEAIRADSRIQIRSETALEAQDNLEASVKIVDEIPILKSKIEGGSGTARDVIQNIDRVDVGIKLTLRPHIIPNGEVRMELHPVIEAVIGAASSSVEFTPTIARREVSTTVTVPDGETIVIAGLTRNDRQRVSQKVPLLGDIPLLGLLFRTTSEANKKTDMLIFVTPRIVRDEQSARALATEWERKTGIGRDEPAP